MVHLSPLITGCSRGGGAPPLCPLKHLEIFALFPVRHFGLEALDLGVLDVDVVVDKARAQRVAEERIVLQRNPRASRSVFGSKAAFVS